MKKIFLAFVALACAISSCSDDDQVETSVTETLELSVESAPVGPDGAEVEIVVTSSAAWRIAGDCPWARPSAVAGNSGDKVVFTVDANETGARREATFKFFAGATVVPFKIVSDPVFVLEMLSDTEYQFSTSASSLCLRLNSNIDDLQCEIVYENADPEDMPWIEYNGKSQSFGSTALNFAITENITYLARRAQIVISGLDKRFEVSVAQDKPSFFEWNAAEKYAYEDIEAHDFTVEVRTNLDYEVSFGEKCDWITMDRSLVSEQKGLRTEMLTFHVAASEKTRSAKGEVYLNGNTWQSHTSFTVSQKDPNMLIVEIPDSKFLKFLKKYGYIEEVGDGMYTVSEEGAAATEFDLSYEYISDFTGLAYFTELTAIDVTGNNMTSFDISALTKVQQLSIGNCSDCQTIVLGANPIKQLEVLNGRSQYVDFETLTISGEAVEEFYSSCSRSYDEIKTVDLSGCPSLKVIECERANLGTLILAKALEGIQINLTTNAESIEYK
ncbi:MAG: hypothetical protein KHX48_03645 [Alistipes sp.]|nr:hypothetical protein [Alistipes sp.]